MVDRARGSLARLFEDGSVANLTDAQLLDRFATRRGSAAEAAFEALVGRHGPMVARVCRTCLRDENDVEDAFQATFMVLVRRANSLGERDLLGPWLYGVAHRVARKARAVVARRRGREGGQADSDPPARHDGAGQVEVDLAPVLHEEVNRLPDKYRQPVVLCHLQGLTHAEAALQLAWPVGTVSVRLVRARKILADRLARRGVTASAALVAAGLTSEATAATLAPAWAQAAAVAALTAATGLPLVAGTAAVSAGAVTLARRTSLTLFLSSWKWLAVPVALFVAVGTGAVLVDSNHFGAQRPTPPSLRVEQPPARESRLGAVRSSGPVSGTKQKITRASKGKTLVANKQTSSPLVPSVVEMPGTGLELGALPPGYFDLAAPEPGKPGSPQPVQVGQTLAIDLLEALPGRPLSGKRIVRSDGTISLGFYGDLVVAGLNRDQIKVKMIEKMRVYLKDEVLGLIRNRDGTMVAIPPVESNRVFVDDQPDGGSSDVQPAVPVKQPAPGSARSEIPARAAKVANPTPDRESASPAELAKLRQDVADLSAKIDSALRATEKLPRRSETKSAGSTMPFPRTP